MSEQGIGAGIITERWVYPIKGMAGFAVPEDVPVYVNEYGVAGSREWMVVNDAGVPVSPKQQENRDLLTVRPSYVSPNSFVFDEDCKVTTEDAQGTVWDIEVYKDMMRGQEAPKATEWLQKRLGRSGLHVVHFDESAGRQVVEEKAWKGTAPRAFVDGAQVHIINAATLAFLAQEWGQSHETITDIRRWRPDFVVSGLAPEQEYTWGPAHAVLAIGQSVQLVRSRPLDRCNLPGISPDDLQFTTEVNKVLKAMSRMQTPQDDTLRLCMGVGVDVHTSGVVRHEDTVCTA